MKIAQMVRLALLMALVAVATLAIRIPVPATQGYVNIGDSVVLVAGLLGGFWVGALAGGVGSALADLYGGYAHWAPFTLLIKGLEGGLVGWLAGRLQPNWHRPGGLILGGGIALVGLLCMVAGYFLVEWRLYSWAPALASLPANTIQAGASLLVGVPLAAVLGRSGLFARAG
ncbi:MAG: ECF transporter S component [Candidatus Latescibacteria bacterium]|nr:ECF transporter S component [Candidatus Latescibacterota bacterium]